MMDLLRKIFRRRIPKCLFIQFDGVKREVAVCCCARCSNHFWVEHVDIERPSFCPFCGVQFKGYQVVTNSKIKCLMDGN